MVALRSLSKDDFAMIRTRIERGDHLHDIAAAYSLNPGRISEIKNGKYDFQPWFV